jgi:hypothetical protein
MKVETFFATDITVLQESMQRFLDTVPDLKLESMQHSSTYNPGYGNCTYSAVIVYSEPQPQLTPINS